MPYFARVFTESEQVPSLHDMRLLVSQYGATLTTQGDEEEWDVLELLYDDDEQPVDVERYLPATDGLFEEDINGFRATVSMCEGEAVQRILDALDQCRQIFCFRVPDEADETVFGPLNAAMDAITHSIGGIVHAENEGFYEGTDLILPME